MNLFNKETDIKIYIREYIKNELILDYKSYIVVNELISELIFYLKSKSIDVPTNYIKLYIRSILSEDYNLEGFKSQFYKGTRVYVGFRFKSKEANIYMGLDYFIYKLNDLELKVNELYELKIKFNQLEIKFNDLKDLEMKVNLPQEIINNKRKIENNSIDEFIDKFLEYSDTSSEILYLQTIIESYTNYVGYDIHVNDFAKKFKHIINLKYPNIESKRHDNKKCYKYLILKDKDV